MRRFLHPAIFVAAFLALATAAGYFGENYFFLDIFSNFRWHYLLISFAALPIFALKKRKFAATIALVCLLLNGWECARYFPKLIQLPKQQIDATALFANVRQGNKNVAAAISLVQTVNPDIVVFTEVSDEWDKALSAIAAQYPYSLRRPAPHKFGMVAYSKFPILAEHVYELPGIAFPNYVFDLTLTPARKQIRLIAAHGAAPTSQLGFDLRNHLLSYLATLVTQDVASTILVGDLNVAPWSVHFRRFLQQSNLGDARLGGGIRSTWPAFLARFGVGIPIDYCLTSTAEAGELKTAELDGSDHLAVICKLSVSTS